MASRNGASSPNATVSPKGVERRTNVPILYNLLSLPLMLILASLELGAGGGLVGLAVAMGCPVNHSIYITDQENMFELMGKNIVLNGLESRVKELVLNWYGPPKMIEILGLTERAGVKHYQKKSSKQSPMSF
jgi:hypothetical protein